MIDIREESDGEKTAVTLTGRARGENVTDAERGRADRVMQFLHDDSVAIGKQTDGPSVLVVNDPHNRLRKAP